MKLDHEPGSFENIDTWFENNYLDVKYKTKFLAIKEIVDIVLYDAKKHIVIYQK